MPTFSEFYGHGYETSSIPLTIVDVHESDIWPIADNSNAAKDAIGAGLHPVIAIGGRTIADGRPLNLTGVVVSFTAGPTTATGRIAVNIADGYIVKNYVANVLTYTPGAAALTFESAPALGQPVYVDDSDDLGAGCTLSLSALNDDNPGLRNPLAGVLWYCQDEYVDTGQGGGVTSAVWPKSWSEAYSEYLVCILLFNGGRNLA